MNTVVLLCGERLPSGTAPDGRVVTDLCRHPEQIPAIAAGADRLVLGLCGGHYSLGAVQRQVRRTGLDPLGVEILDVGAAAAPGVRLDVIIAGARARAEAFRGSRPEQAKMVIPQEASRRALLTFALPEYVAGPAVDAAVCAADRGCTACVDVCPQKAFAIVKGRVLHDRNACEPCGRCVTTCPTGAIENPAATVAQVEAQVRALLDLTDAPSERRGIVYRCRGGERAVDGDGWYAVTLPCAAMVPPSWLLAPLLLGASAVALVPCTDTGCALAQDAVVRDAVTWTRQVLVALGIAAERVTTDPAAAALDAPLRAADLSNPFGRLGGAAVLVALAGAAATTAPAPPPPLAAPPGTFGVVDIDAAACTGCGTCTAACPTGALAARDADGRRRITFDATACVACGACAGRCPERQRGAIAMRPAVDVERLRQGRVTLFGNELATCSSCGATVAPAAMLARLRDLIGDDLVFQGISRLCLDCRGITAGV